MVGFKGRISMKQYMPMKPTKRGFKVWCRCSPNGMTSDYEVYEVSTNQSRETSLSSAVILGLAKNNSTRKANISLRQLVF
jgi:hypothetical protein